MSDHAVVIGVDCYPGMSDLAGACNDATAFRQWLLRADGGGLAADTVRCLLTHDFPAPSGPDDARPVLGDMQRLFAPLVEQAALGHVDGRLFIYLAGHGYADPSDVRSAALYTANARFLYPLHLAVLDYANFFHRCWAFDEIIVVMDACRSVNPIHDIQRASLPRLTPHVNAHKVKTFLAFGAGYGQESRERDFEDGKVHGIFTRALLDALDKTPANHLGHVKGTAVKRYVHNAIDRFAAGLPVAPPDIHADEFRDVTLARRGFVPGTAGGDNAVEFQVAPEYLGRELCVLYGGWHEVRCAVIEGVRLYVPLFPGLFKARIRGTDRQANFEVPADARVVLA